MKKFITLLFVMLLSMSNQLIAEIHDVIYEEDLPVYYIVDSYDTIAKAVSTKEYVAQYPRENLYFRDEVEYKGKIFTVTRISSEGSYNAYRFRGLKTLRLPAHLQTIKGDPFNGSGSLDELFIPSEVKGIDRWAFGECRIKRVLNSSRVLTSTEFLETCEHPIPRLIDVDTICVGDGFKYYIYGDVKCIYEIDNADEATHIDIPEGYHYDRALFKDCKKLESVTLPAELDSIPMEFFSGCERLKVVNGLEHIRTIGEDAFYRCRALESVSLPKIEKIGDYAFCECDGLKDVNLGESLTEICEGALALCNLKEIILPKSIKHLGTLALAYNDFQECILPESITEVGKAVFEMCQQLKSIIIPQNIIVIPNGFCYGCTGLKEVVLPSKLECVGGYAFEKCRSLTNIALPETVKALGDYTFYDCESLCLLKCEAAVPPKANNSTFDGIPYYKCEVRVPEESVEDYRNADGWWNFRLWNEEWTGAIEEISLDEAVPSPAFDLMGRPTGSNDKGLRILRQGNTTRKVLIR